MAKSFEFGNITGVNKNFNNADKMADDSVDNGSALQFEINMKEKIVQEKKYFQTHIDPEILMEVDKIANRTGHTRNDIVVKMIKFCVENVKYI